MAKEKIVLGHGAVYEFDTTNPEHNNLNQNVIVVGGSGSGKTCSTVIPTLLSAKESSYVVCDPKGRLEKLFTKHFKKKGYRVLSLDLIDLSNNDFTLEPTRYVTCEGDFAKISRRFIYSQRRKNHMADYYWQDSSSIVLDALIAGNYMLGKTFADVLDDVSRLECGTDNEVNAKFQWIQENYGSDCFALSQFRKFQTLIPAERTFAGVVNTLQASLGPLQTEEIMQFLRLEKHLDFYDDLVKEKTILFIKIPDLDDTLYDLLNVFLTLCFDELCNIADAMPNGALPRHVKFIFDDFATSITPMDFDRVMSNIRARNISVFILLQNRKQLISAYSEAQADTIIGNADTVVYMGIDLDTAKELSIRLDQPITDILYMPIGEMYVLQRGSRPLKTTRIPLQELEGYAELLKDQENIQR